jgi:hypothetical protein
MREVSHKKLNF